MSCYSFFRKKFNQMEFNPKMENWFTFLVTDTAGTATCVGLSLFAGESGLVDQTDVWILWFILTTHYSYILLSKISLQSLQHQTDWITTLCLELHVKDISNLPYCFTYKKLYWHKKSQLEPRYIKQMIFKTCHLYIFKSSKDIIESQSPP